jgi:hypothetical protein
MGCRARRDRREHLLIRPLVVLRQAADQQLKPRGGRKRSCCSSGMTRLRITTTPRIRDESGHRLAKARLPEGVAGMARLHALLGEHVAHLDSDTDSGRVAVGIESDRGPWVRALVAGGYRCSRSIRCRRPGCRARCGSSVLAFGRSSTRLPADLEGGLQHLPGEGGDERRAAEVYRLALARKCRPRHFP